MAERTELERRELRAEQEAAGALVNLVNGTVVSLDGMAEADKVSSHGEDEEEKEAGSDEDVVVIADSDDDEEGEDEDEDEATEDEGWVLVFPF